MRFSKGDILSMFRRQEQAYLMATLAGDWLRDTARFTPSAVSQARGLRMLVRDGWRSFDDIADGLETEDRYLMVSHFMHNQLHTLIRAPFEVLRAYCEDHDKAAATVGLSAQMKGQAWYWFAYSIRNAVSHNFLFEFREHVVRRLPVTWNGITLTVALEGQPLTDLVFGHKPGFELFLQMRDFAEALPDLAP